MMNDEQWWRLSFEIEQVRKEFFEARQHSFKVALIENIVTNGRWINGMSFVLMVALAVTVAPLYFYGALLPIGSVGSAWLGDQLQSDRLGRLSALLAILPVLLFVINGI